MVYCRLPELHVTRLLKYVQVYFNTVPVFFNVFFLKATVEAAPGTEAMSYDRLLISICQIKARKSNYLLSSKNVFMSGLNTHC